MARVDVIMPQMGESIAEGTLSKWLKKVGDEVKRDEPIFEISTDKVDAEIPAPIGRRAGGDHRRPRGRRSRCRRSSRASRRRRAASIAPCRAAAPRAGRLRRHAARGPPHGASYATAAAQLRTLPPRPPPSAATGGNGLEDRLRTKSSPLVRKIAAEHGIEIAAHARAPASRAASPSATSSSIIASGAARRRRRAPVHARARRRRAARTGAASRGPATRVEAMSKIRALTSDHMVASRRTERARHVVLRDRPHARRAHPPEACARSSRRRPGRSSPILPFIIKTVVDTLKQFPVLNAAVAGRNIIYRKQYNIGIAVALDWGLIVPVIKHADDLSLSGLTQDAQRSRRSRAHQAAQARRGAGRDVHDHQSRRVRFAHGHADHSARHVGHPRTRRDREAPEGHHRRRWRGHDRHPDLRVLLVCRSTIASSTAPMPTSSSPPSRRDSRTFPEAHSEHAACLTIQRTLVTPPERAKFAERLEAKARVLRAGGLPLLGVRGDRPAGRVPRVLRGARRRDARSRARLRARARARSGAHLSRSGASRSMPTRTITLDGRAWQRHAVRARHAVRPRRVRAALHLAAAVTTARCASRATRRRARARASRRSSR